MVGWVLGPALLPSYLHVIEPGTWPGGNGGVLREGIVAGAGRDLFIQLEAGNPASLP